MKRAKVRAVLLGGADSFSIATPRFPAGRPMPGMGKSRNGEQAEMIDMAFLSPRA
jgi:hypothetical protein